MAGRSKEEIDSLLSKAEPQFQQMNQQYSEQDTRWLNEIAMLERRVETLYEEVDLGNGDRIAVRTALSDMEMEELTELEKILTSESSAEEKNEVAYRQLELLTANPFLTADWFRENRDKWPVADGLAIIMGFAENKLRAQQERVEKIRKFRNE